jgi:hypothetical protein
MYMVYSKLILFIEQERRDHYEQDEKYKKKKEREMRTYRHVSMDHVYQAGEHYRCVVVTDYRVGRQERTEWLSAFVRSPSWFRFFLWQ